MPTVNIAPTGGLNLQLNPLLHKPGDLIRAVNVESYYTGAKKKRAGYTQFLSADTTIAGSAITQLFNWQKDDGTTSYLYAVSSGRVLYYDINSGATDWSIAGNGTVSADWVGNAVLENTLILGDGVGSTRHTTNGTALTNTTLAPIAQHFAVHSDQRVYAVRNSTSFRSTPGDATNWLTSGTSSSDSFNVPGPGALNGVFTLGNLVQLPKNSGNLFRWDSYNLFQIPTNQGPASPMSMGTIEDLGLYLNRNGIWASKGGIPEILSTPIQKQIYNDAGSGINGALFGTARAVAHRFDYFLSAGTISDDLTGETVSNCLIKYNYPSDEWVNFSFADYPTSYVSYKDASGVPQLLFGDATGKVYSYGGTATTDNGDTIEAVMEGLIHGGTLLEKTWKRIRLLFNPGCQAKVQIAVTNTFLKGQKRWIDVGDASSGVVEYEFGDEINRGRLLFYRIYEASSNGRFEWYGGEVDYEVVVKR